MKKEPKNSIQEWLPFEKILNNGILKINSTTYVKILKVNPINYQLKSNLEKEAILNSYHTFLKTCNFDLQIIIQNIRQNIFQFVSKISTQEKNPILLFYLKEYLQYIENFNAQKKLCYKNYYIILKKSNLFNDFSENKMIEELTENSYKIKENLSKCGNTIEAVEDKNQIISILISFFKPMKEIEEGEKDI